MVDSRIMEPFPRVLVAEDDPVCRTLLVGLLRGDAFHDAVTALHGQRVHRTGEITLVEKTPPWDQLL